MHVSAIEGVKVALFVIVILGTAKLWAEAYPDNAVSQAIQLIY